MNEIGRKAHWENVYQGKGETGVSWYQKDPRLSLELITSVADPVARRIIDVGGGASVLVDRLLDAGFSRITVLDISGAALGRAKERLGARADAVRWLEADVTTVDAVGEFDLWHDRAVFHFLTAPDDRRRYIELAERTIPPGGHLVMGTFARGGPTKCSGMDVRRYDSRSLGAELGEAFSLVSEATETHLTPGGSSQDFFFGVFRREA
jgi:SAM-dependent methyltransferase